MGIGRRRATYKLARNVRPRNQEMSTAGAPANETVNADSLAQRVPGFSKHARIQGYKHLADYMQRSNRMDSNRTEWPVSRPQGSRSQELARYQSGAEPDRDYRVRVLAPTPDAAPREVCYEEENTSAYVVRAPDARQVLVPKARNGREPFPITDGYQVFAARLVRWSAFALIAVALGGVGGIALGLPVVIVAAIRLAEHAQHVRRWHCRR